ncbi:MAG: hypothetical protein V3V29_03760 [Acidimicrobiia bacterium]
MAALWYVKSTVLLLWLAVRPLGKVLPSLAEIPLTAAIYFGLWRNTFSGSTPTVEWQRDLFDWMHDHRWEVVLGTAVVLILIVALRKEFKFNPPFGVALKVLSPEVTSRLYGSRVMVRIEVTTRRSGRFRAYLADTDGGRASTSRIPLEWTNEDAPEIDLIPHQPQQITVGRLDYWTKDDELSEFQLVPRSPGLDRHPIIAVDGVDPFNVRVDVVDVKTFQSGTVCTRVWVETLGDRHFVPRSEEIPEFAGS